MRYRPAHRSAYAGMVLPVVFVTCWEVAARFHDLPDYLIAPSRIVSSLYSMTANGELWEHLGPSLFRAFGGFAAGGAIGIVMGLFAGTSRLGDAFLNPLVSMVYPIPKVAFMPILIIWLGLGDLSKIATIALSVFFPAFINAVSGTRSVPPLYVWAAQAMGASRSRIFFLVVLPASLPQILSGMRVGLGLAFISLFAVELFGARSGLGYLIGVAEDSSRYDLMYVAIIAIGLSGFLSDRLLIAVRLHLLAGQRVSREEFIAKG